MQKPEFLEKLSKAASKSWHSQGSISCKAKESGDGKFDIMFFPTIREIYGGNKDGERFFPGFNFDIGKFIRVFDVSPSPKVSFDCLRTNFIEHLMFRGFIDGLSIKVAILSAPPSGQEAAERVYAVGPKIGVIEDIQR